MESGVFYYIFKCIKDIAPLGQIRLYTIPTSLKGYLNWLTHSPTHSLLFVLSSTHHGFSKPCVAKLEIWLSKCGLTSERFPIQGTGVKQFMRHQVNQRVFEFWLRCDIPLHLLAIFTITNSYFILLKFYPRCLQKVQLTDNFQILESISSRK